MSTTDSGQNGGPPKKTVPNGLGGLLGRIRPGFSSQSGSEPITEPKIECLRCGRMVTNDDTSHQCVTWVRRVEMSDREMAKFEKECNFSSYPLGTWLMARQFLRQEIVPDAEAKGIEFPPPADYECLNDNDEGIYPHLDEVVHPEGGVHPSGAKGICDPCFLKVLSDFSLIPKAQRDTVADAGPILERFRGVSEDLDWAWRRMKKGLESIWVHQANAEDTAAQIGEIGKAAVREFNARFFEDDRQQLIRTLRIPAIDPEAGNEPSSSLTVGGILTAAISLLLAFTVEPGVFGGMVWVGLAMVLINGRRHSKWEERRAASYVAPWEPTKLLDGIDEGFRERETAALLLAKFLVMKKLSDAGESAKPSDWAASVDYRWNPLGPLPTLPERPMTPLEAEDFVKRIMSYLGESGAKTTRYVNDGGIDVVSDHYAVQVKHEATKIGPSVVRETFGVATSLGKRAGVFSKSGFTKSAIDFADENDVLLVRYEPSLAGVSKAGRAAVSDGLVAASHPSDAAE